MFFERKGDSIILRVRLSPNSSVPEKGKANQELVKFLGRLLRLPKSEIKIIGGETDRCKKLQLPFAAETAEKLQSLSEEA